MNDDLLQRLLEHADGAAPAPRLSGDLAAGVRRRHRRRTRRRRNVTMAMIGLLAGGVIFVAVNSSDHAPPPEIAAAPPPAIQSSPEPPPSEPLIRLAIQLEQTAALMLDRARRYDASADTRDQAEREYQRLIELFPDTTAAAEARQRSPRGGQRRVEHELNTGV